MTKELQDLAWSVLPKEFKEGVKRDYKITTEDVKWDEAYNCALEETFGLHNLTSDAEGEEMLCAPKSKAMQLYSHLLDLVENEHMSEHYSEWCDVESEYIALFGENVFADYFGSKCLPDEEKPQPKFHNGDRVKVITDCWKDNIYTILDIKEVYPQFSYKLSCSPDDWFAESTLELAKEPKPFKYNVGQKVILHFYGGEVSTITEAFNDGGVWNKYKVKMLPARVWNENELDPYEEPKPAEPKFKVGDTASYVCSPTIRHKCTVTKVMQNEHSGKWEYNVMFEWGKPGMWIPESDLAPYTEPTDLDKESSTCTNDCPSQCPSQNFDNIVNRGFRDHNRLHIAAQIVAALYANYQAAKGFKSIEELVRKALDITDTLIKESEKGDLK